MSFVFATPGVLATATTDLASIGSALSAANLTAAGPTTALPAAAADEVSAAVAALFGDVGQSSIRRSVRGCGCFMSSSCRR